MFVTLIAVLSLDGRLTRPHEPGPGFASPEDQEWFRLALREFDCAVMGRATWDTIREQVAAETGRRRLRVVLTRDPTAHAGETVPGAVEFSGAPPAGIVAELRGRGFRRCALLGGGQVYRAFLDAGLVDALWLTLESVILGGGTPLADGPVAETHGRFALEEMRLLAPSTLLLNYRRPEGRPLRLPV
jgi:riboflavin biosynthesis pyrimidine reductase